MNRNKGDEKGKRREVQVRKEKKQKKVVQTKGH